MGHIEKLKEENENLIDTISKHVGEYLKANVVDEQIPAPQLHPDDNLVVDVLPSGIMNNLCETARLMVVNGFEKECCNMYSSCRREFLKQCLSSLGLQVEELNMEYIDNIMEKIEIWIKALNIAVTILFPNERRLCDVVFRLASASDFSFKEVCKELTLDLLRFVNTLATENHSPYHLSHVIPKVFKTFSDLIPNFNSFFSGQLFSESLINEALLVGKRLGIFVELESLIRRDMAQATTPGGELHPTTFKVMDYLRDVFTDSKSFPIREGKSPFSDQVARIIVLLESNLEAKSKTYTDPALGYVFMINNLIFLQHGGSIYGVIFGEDWYIEKIKQNIELYQRSSWDKILDFLKLDSYESESMKEKLKLFNLHFNETCKVQSGWFIFDELLRQHIIKSIENMLLPTYGNFLGRFQDVVGKDAYDCIEYGISHIQDRLSLLFLASN
ncbi:exocyst complex component EXO70B1-like [Abrus precatorius]|uniref:Exocyst subunit Exo70 family protein n=1 Tax=Abrus precatorius TaxID=3816 RepID=A0A8B8MLG9_ABRPR|nr:exocyst complex component EXO70B1-like [Abrus precatorius]